MFSFLRRLFRRFFRNSRQINNEPLNKVSLIFIILIDLFILFNTFQGIYEISQWPLSPSQAYPCYYEWNAYRQQTGSTKEKTFLRNMLEPKLYSAGFPGDGFPENGFATGGVSNTTTEQFRQTERGHLGKVSEICFNYAALKDQAANPETLDLFKEIEQKRRRIEPLEADNAQIREQYDSTLLEKIAGQSPDQSINAVSASQAKQRLDSNKEKISALEQEIKTLEQTLRQEPATVELFNFLKNDKVWQPLDKSYRKAQFWYPSIQLLFQSAFLLPLIGLTLWIHRICQQRGYGLAALISWHLLVVFCIPLIFKLFELLQFGPVLTALSSFILELAQGLVFFVRYAAILTIPLIGFGLIKFFQRFVFNPKIQAANRVQKGRCLRCAKRLSQQDQHCPHCGYHQLQACSNCNTLTYKHLPHCRNCGASQ